MKQEASSPYTAGRWALHMLAFLGIGVTGLLIGFYVLHKGAVEQPVELLALFQNPDYYQRVYSYRMAGSALVAWSCFTPVFMAGYSLFWVISAWNYRRKEKSKRQHGFYMETQDSYDK